MEKKKIFDFLDKITSNKILDTIFVKIPDKTPTMFSLLEYMTLLSLVKFITEKTHNTLSYFVYYIYLFLFTLFLSKKIVYFFMEMNTKYIPSYENIVKGKTNWKFFMGLIFVLLLSVAISFFINKTTSILINLIINSTF